MAKAAEEKKTVKKGGKGGAKPGAIDRVRFPKIVKKRNQMPKGKHGGMQLMLIEDVAHVGKQGEVVEVKPGYGRNFLLPHGLAAYVTPSAKIRIEKHQAKQQALRQARVAELKVVGKKLEAVSITIEANATEEGHLYGSVAQADIAAALAKQEKFGITAEQIILEGPLKELGLYHVKVRLAEEVESEIKVWVVPAGGAKPAG
jgi:large subunit ribosomal protein L9